MTRPAVLITGAAHRLGAQIARRFSAAGWQVAIHYRSSHAAAEALADELGDAFTISGEMADPADITRMAEEMNRAVGARWRCLVNSASVFDLDDAKAIDPAVFTGAMQTNAAGPVLLTQAFLALPHPGGRRVINVLDQKLANPNPDFFSYSMSKAALGMATRMLAMASDEQGLGDRIYGLCPGAMLPSFDQQTQEHERSGRMNLLERLTEPEELADTALFLAEGPAAGGTVIHVDSGQHLLSQPHDVLFMARMQNG